MCYDDTSKYTYCGPEIRDGVLTILFSWDRLGTNSYDCLNDTYLQKALNEAPPAPSSDGAGGLSYAARTSIKKDWEPNSADLQKRIAELVGMPTLKLVPNFETNFAALLAYSKTKAGKDMRDDWQTRIGDYFKQHFEGLEYVLKSQNFGDDDLLQEGFQEGVEKAEVQIRIVEKLETGQSSYNECKVADGVLYIQVCDLLVEVLGVGGEEYADVRFRLHRTTGIRISAMLVRSSLINFERWMSYCRWVFSGLLSRHLG
jgi:hypothetical protein